MKDIDTTIFTDGSSRGNPGPGGWGAVIVRKLDRPDKGIDTDRYVIRELGGYEKMTTNNRMELTAALSGLSHVSTSKRVMVYTDSSYVINGITKWIKGWKRKGWKTKTGDGVLNRDLWERLDEATSTKRVTWKYVGGHVGIVGNERCDHIATDLADGNEVMLFDGPISDYDLPNILDISADDIRVLAKQTDSSRARAKAYSYVSAVDCVIETHRTWAECERRVKGVRGAKYKKSIDMSDEAKIVKEFEAIL